MSKLSEKLSINVSKSLRINFLFAIICLFANGAAMASSAIDGEALSIMWCLPFAGLLMSIALMPMFAERFWHNNYGKVAAMWSILVIIALFMSVTFKVVIFELLHILLKEYLPFVILIAAMFILSGGIRLEFKSRGSPEANVLVMTVASLIASWIGTTGAAMLFIRPVMDLNAKRTHKVHTMVFFILLVCNIGGALTPIGDPPLFMGFLKGINFFWPLQNMLMPFLFMEVSLLLIFYLVDKYLFIKHDKINAPMIPKMKISGWDNMALLGIAVSIVIMSGIIKNSYEFHIHHIHLSLNEILRSFGLLICIFVSVKVLPQSIRQRNAFDLEPLWEVAKLFAGIFITAAPVLLILSAAMKVPLVASLI